MARSFFVFEDEDGATEDAVEDVAAAPVEAARVFVGVLVVIIASVVVTGELVGMTTEAGVVGTITGTVMIENSKLLDDVKLELMISKFTPLRPPSKSNWSPSTAEVAVTRSKWKPPEPPESSGTTDVTFHE